MRASLVINALVAGGPLAAVCRVAVAYSAASGRFISVVTARRGGIPS